MIFRSDASRRVLHERWIGDVVAWSEHFRVHAIDLLGEPGLSAEVRPALDVHADWLDDVLDGLGIGGTVSMVASSLGGWFALDYAIRRPERVRKLALLTPSGIGRQKSLIFLPAVFLLPFDRWGILQTLRLVAGPLPPGEPTEYGEFALMKHEHFRPRRVSLPIFTDEQLEKLELLVIAGGRDRMLDSHETKRRLPKATVFVTGRRTCVAGPDREGADVVEELGGVRVFVSDGPVGDEGDAVQLIAQAHYEHQAEWVALTAEGLGDEFFELQTGRAGAITQKFVNYRMGLVVVGDISDKLAVSKPLRDWVRESNRGRSLWFVDELSELAGRFTAEAVS